MDANLLKLLGFLVLSFAAVLLLVWAMGAVLRARMRRIIQEVPNINVSDWFIGPGSAIAIDQKQPLIYFCKALWKKPQPIKPSEIVFPGENVTSILESQFQGQSSETGSTLGACVAVIAFGRYRLRIPTNIYEMPEISVSFWRKKRAQQCDVRLRAFVRQSDQVVKVGSEESDEKGRLIQALRSRIPASEQMSRKVGKRALNGHIQFLMNNFETICTRPSGRGDGKLITEALHAVLGREEEDPVESGYTFNSLLSTVSRCKVTKPESNGKKFH